MVTIDSGSILVYGDIACPWATCAAVRLHRYRAELGLQDAISFDHRAFPLELVDERPTQKPLLDAQVPVAGQLEPEAGFRVWAAPEWTWPGTVLLALEAVQLAKRQGMQASEDLDLGLRRALFRDHRNIGLRSVILDVAAATPGLDADDLAKALDSGDGRSAVVDQWRAADDIGVETSPHLFLPDGSDVANPGVETHWRGEPVSGTLVVDEDDPSVYEAILRRATAG